ncbi:hypothetical protein ZHAS_00006705 [Anopheles sinensis]|uniref:Uncharacterized protein n=1 Tax=Anopheles sinensis TaxID=74873 RepID=A0A084VM04_ANOSI|nr:hypothetical protein ZHAS_00006705 [Anopheles sinensis]
MDKVRGLMSGQQDRITSKTDKAHQQDNRISNKMDNIGGLMSGLRDNRISNKTDKTHCLMSVQRDNRIISRAKNGL